MRCTNNIIFKQKVNVLQWPRVRFQCPKDSSSNTRYYTQQLCNHEAFIFNFSFISLICKMGIITVLLDITTGTLISYFNLLTALYLPQSSPRQEMIFRKFIQLSNQYHNPVLAYSYHPKSSLILSAVNPCSYPQPQATAYLLPMQFYLFQKFH